MNKRSLWWSGVSFLIGGFFVIVAFLVKNYLTEGFSAEVIRSFRSFLSNYQKPFLPEIIIISMVGLILILIGLISVIYEKIKEGKIFLPLSVLVFGGISILFFLAFEILEFTLVLTFNRGTIFLNFQAVEIYQAFLINFSKVLFLLAVLSGLIFCVFFWLLFFLSKSLWQKISGWAAFFYVLVFCVSLVFFNLNLNYYFNISRLLLPVIYNLVFVLLGLDLIFSKELSLILETKKEENRSEFKGNDFKESLYQVKVEDKDDKPEKKSFFKRKSKKSEKLEMKTVKEEINGEIKLNESEIEKKENELDFPGRIDNDEILFSRENDSENNY